jgi:hypothetical protein
MIKKFAVQVQLVGRTFDKSPSDPISVPRYNATIQQLMIESAESDFPHLVRQVEILVIGALNSEKKRFLDLLCDSTVWQNQLPSMIRDAAQSVLSTAFKKISIDKVVAEHKIEQAAVNSWLNEQLNRARPSVDDCGGRSRLLLALPRLSSKSRFPQLIEKIFGLKLRAINGTAGDFVLCLEVEKINLANVAFRILESNPDVTELAKRIHTRDDVPWNTLNDVL